MNSREPEFDTKPSLLIVDDDEVLGNVMAKALMRRGYQVSVARSAEEACCLIDRNAPEYAVVDLKMNGASGLTLIPKLRSADEHTRILMLTGHASIATAVEAIKLGATYYLTKPADVDQILAAFGREKGDESISVTEKPLSVERLEWEHINRVLMEHDGNISATARALGMHRRTLQRKLTKHAPRG